MYVLLIGNRNELSFWRARVDDGSRYAVRTVSSGHFEARALDVHRPRSLKLEA